MTRTKMLTNQFVKSIPEKFNTGVLYVSMEYGLAAHKCCCGCGREVMTPLTPTDWKLIFDGESITLDPSIGNWSFPCRSHYWIERNKIIWSHSMSKTQIAAGRIADLRAKQEYYRRNLTRAHSETVAKSSASFWHRLAKWGSC